MHFTAIPEPSAKSNLKLPTRATYRGRRTAVPPKFSTQARHRERRLNMAWESSSSSPTSSATSSPTTSETHNQEPEPLELPETPYSSLLHQIVELAVEARSSFTLFSYPAWNFLNEIICTASPLPTVWNSEYVLSSSVCTSRMGLVTDLVLRCMDSINADAGPLEAFGCREAVEMHLNRILELLYRARQAGLQAEMASKAALERDVDVELRTSENRDKIVELAERALSAKNCPVEVQSCLDGILSAAKVKQVPHKNENTFGTRDGDLGDQTSDSEQGGWEEIASDDDDAEWDLL
ncbi:hypothetical protein HDU98_010869 [Podochytrium sp. JEL0797]|nr:hypothetical protein HDU98_010869 [Podochytrium sp. JEL0797]